MQAHELLHMYRCEELVYTLTHFPIQLSILGGGGGGGGEGDRVNRSKCCHNLEQPLEDWQQHFTEGLVKKILGFYRNEWTTVDVARLVDAKWNGQIWYRYIAHLPALKLD